jgi:DNA polymerase elongation subunit (family B)
MNLVKVRGLKVLDFDIECRPIAWYGGDFVTKQPTVIAWSFVGSDETKVSAIGESGNPEHVFHEEADMLIDFFRDYDDADVVTGHFIRGFDLPVLNGAAVRLGFDGPGDKLTQDTKMDLQKMSGVSKSQENLGAMFELDHPKVPMNTHLWAEANVLMRRGIEASKNRAKGDVEQHKEMRGLMLDRGLLRPPSIWTAKSRGGSGAYHA